MPSLSDTLGQLEAGRLDEARASLRALAFVPFAHAPEVQRAFSFACEIALLPDEFPPRLRADLARGLRTGTLADAIVRVRDPLGDDPDSPAAREAIRRHAPLLHAALAGTEWGRSPHDDAPTARPGTIAGVSPWVWTGLALALLRACAVVGG